jgi:chromatin licensing and DNA replication factor 1
LKKLNVQINEAEIKRWHPKFNLDDIPDVEPSELPQPPVVKKFSTAKDVLDEIQDNLNPRVGRHGCFINFP